MTDIKIYRHFSFDILPHIKTRFSARAMNGASLSPDTLGALTEAASFAPSCLNEQPWRFLAAQGERFDALLSCLNEKNQSWAKRAGALILLVSKKTFSANGKPNPWCLSDAGCAAGFMMLEAEERGLYAHAMGGFDKAKARELLGISDEYDVIEVIAVGEPGEPDDLPEALRANEHPQPRRPYAELML